MCDDHGAVLLDDQPVDPLPVPHSHGGHTHSHGRPTRRDFVKGAAGAAAGLYLARNFRAWPAQASPSDGTTPVGMGMHVHSGFSEQYGSMDSHLFEALQNQVPVIFWTDHDHRMAEYRYRSVVHFTSLTSEATDGAPWIWTPRRIGPLKTCSGGIVSSPASPNDPVKGGSLAVMTQSSSGASATYGYYADSHQAGWNYHCNLYGQTITIDVLPQTVSSAGYLEFLLTSSYHPATNGRPAGYYTISYRFGGPGTPGSRSFSGTNGVVYLPYTPGSWSTASFTPTDDIEAIWPDMQSHDFASYSIVLNAVSLGDPVKGNFDYLRFARQYNNGDVPLQTQQQLMTAYAAVYPGVRQYQGMEISWLLPHISWFGGQPTISPNIGTPSSKYPAFVQQQVAEIHSASGVASYNHPCGYGSGALLSSSDQDAVVAKLVTSLAANKLYGCDLLEVGYYSRGGCDLMHHLNLWDGLSRYGLFLTGTGTTDDHFGNNWYGIRNNWICSVWAASQNETDLVSALRAGRSWSASLSRFRGTLDLLVDGTVPMGSVSVSGVNSRQLQVIATGVPAGGSVQVVQGTVDYTSNGSNATDVATYPADALSTGTVTLTVDTSISRFVRLNVFDSHGAIIAVSNPVWLLRENPPNGIPPARQ